MEIPLLTCPTQHLINPPVWDREKQHLLESELQKLLQKGIVTQANHSTAAGFFSSVFTIPKKNGEHRLILNLKRLSQFVPSQHFKMEGVNLLNDLLQPGDWMINVDLK